MDGITTAALYYSDWGDDKGVSTNDGLKWIHLDFNGGERKGTHCNTFTCRRGLESVVTRHARLLFKSQYVLCVLEQDHSVRRSEIDWRVDTFSV